MNNASTFPELLLDELNRRRGRNPRYSLRAFAQALGVSPSFLSKVMSGKKSLSEERFLQIAMRLDLGEELIETFRAKLPGFKSEKLSFTPIEADQFQYISDWQHFAILEALTLDNFSPTIQGLAEKLRISESKVQSAIERLLRLGYIKEDRSGNISRKVRNHTTTHLPVPTSACREHERQILELAIDALDRVDITQRDQTSLTLAIPSSRLSEAREKIDQFRREIASLLQRPGKRDSVYHFSVSFYPVSAFRNPKE